MIEPEIAFADLTDNAALAEALLKYTFAACEAAHVAFSAGCSLYKFRKSA